MMAISEVMPRDLFINMTRYFHVSDPYDETISSDPLKKLAPFILQI